MASDTFLVFAKPAVGTLTPITPEGETKDQTFAPLKAIELDSFSLGVENPTTIGSASSGAGAGKAKFQSFEVTKFVDKASPSLFTACASGAHFPQVDLYIRKAGATSPTGGGTGHSYLLYTFRMVFITTVSWSGGTGQDAPTETVDFVYGALGISYYSQDTTGALATQPEVAQWSQVNNTPTLTVPG